MNKNRDWTVLLIGGASGTGNSKIAYELARFYQVNVLEADDVYQAIKAVTNRDVLPAVHYWSTGINWEDIGVDKNIEWLIAVSKEIAPALKAIAEDHIESKVPVIIEGDFIDPEFVKSFKSPTVKSLFVYEPDRNQILQNYLAREGGKLQEYRADISAAYGYRLSEICKKIGISVVESRPWDTLLERVIEGR